MKETRKNFFDELWASGMDRRTFLKLTAVSGGSMALSGMPVPRAWADDSGIQLADAAYKKLYGARKDWYMNDPKWVKLSKSRLTWPEKGERVPDLEFALPSTNQPWIDAARRWSANAAQLGLKYEIKTLSVSRWLQKKTKHLHTDIDPHPSIMRPERLDASEWLTSRAYGFDRRNYGEWVCKEYDELVRLQAKESNAEKRLELVQKAQMILASDYYITQLGWGPALVEAYNSGQWDGIEQVKGFGIGSTNMFWTYLKAKPKSDRRRMIVGMLQLLKSTNIFAGSHRMRAIGRMVYDRLAYMDKDLNVIPWAAESWKQLDERTWDVTLRDGMKFHDGKPVTVDDLKFTIDFSLKYDRGIIYTAHQWLESCEITNRAERTVRFRFKEPYGQFETYFMLLTIILPKHQFEGIMERQKVGDDLRRLSIPNPLGSGPFKWGKYVKDTELQLIANKEHFAAPNIDELLLVVIPSTDGILGRLQTQEIDITEEVYLTPSQERQLLETDHLTIIKTPDINWLHAAPRVSHLPWRDIEFRRAWHHAIDRSFLVNAAWEGNARMPTSNTFFVEGNYWYNPNLPPIPEFNLEKARKILKDAGYSWDKQGRLVYPPPSDSKWVERVNRVCGPDYTWGGLKMLS